MWTGSDITKVGGRRLELKHTWVEKWRELQTENKRGAEAEPKQSQKWGEEKKDNKPGSWMKERKPRQMMATTLIVFKEEEEGTPWNKQTASCLEKPKAFSNSEDLVDGHSPKAKSLHLLILQASPPGC